MMCSEPGGGADTDATLGRLMVVAVVMGLRVIV
jgi:hypothetical protein